MTKTKSVYVCAGCERQFAKWQGKCDDCGQWNSLQEVAVSAKAKYKRVTGNTSTKRLVEVSASSSDRIVTKISEFNRVMGGGIVKDSLTIITAKPGAGKSTLLLQVAQDVALQGYSVLYASGEESDSQIKQRAHRIFSQISDQIWVFASMSMNDLLEAVKETDPQLIIIDSIQTFVLEEYTARPGTPTQTMECAQALLKIAKSQQNPKAVMMVGQMTKEDEMAGVRALEHLVDTVLVIDTEHTDQLKLLTASKNRYGSTGETGFFSLTEQGMLSLENPYKYFITERMEAVPGSALTVVREGSRFILLEIESLVSSSITSFPSRIGEGIRRELLQMLISVLEERGRVKLFDKNVVVKTTGGLKLRDPAANLAVIMSIVSSVKNIAIPGDVVFIADVGLTGELKRVPSIESRIQELDRMGFKRVYVAKNTNLDVDGLKIEVVRANNLQEVMAFFSRRDLVKN